MVYSLFVFTLVNPCDTKEKGGCGQICLKAEDEGYDCACRDGFVLASDYMNCLAGE